MSGAVSNSDVLRACKRYVETVSTKTSPTSANTKQRQTRIAWALTRKFWTEDDRAIVIWSEETKICIPVNDDFLTECSTANLKHPVCAMVRASMPRHGAGCLIVNEDNIIAKSIKTSHISDLFKGDVQRCIIQQVLHFATPPKQVWNGWW